MLLRRLCGCLLMAFAALTVSLPVQAAMVGTAQMQAGSAVLELSNIKQQRDWIRTELVKAGVEETDALKRVASMTDAQVAKIHQRIEAEPAGGSSGLVILVLILVITELMGYTDIVPGWPEE